MVEVDWSINLVDFAHCSGHPLSMKVRWLGGKIVTSPGTGDRADAGCEKVIVGLGVEILYQRTGSWGVCCSAWLTAVTTQEDETFNRWCAMVPALCRHKKKAFSVAAGRRHVLYRGVSCWVTKEFHLKP